MNFARLFIRFSLILSLLAQVTVSAKVAIRKPSSISSNDEIQDFLLLCWDHGAYRSGLQALEQNKLNLPQPVFHWWRGTFFMATENYYLAEKEFACLDSMIAAVDPKTPFRFISLTGITEAISMQMDRSNADLYAKQAILLLSNQVEVNIGEKWPRFQMGMAFFNLAHNARNNFTKADHEEFLKRYQEAGKLIALGRKILQPLLLKYPGLEAWVEIQEGNYNTDLTFYWSEAKSQSGGFGVNSHKAEAVLHYQSARKNS